MRNRNVIVIGGGAAGLQAAISAKSTYPEKSVTLVRREEKALVPCGIPYIFGSMDCSDKDIMPDALLTNLGVEIKIGEVDSLDLEEKVCSLNGDEQLSFEKLVIATGSTPIKPKWLKGADLENVFIIPKNKLYLDEMRERLGSLKKVIVIGAGFIGVEMTDEMNKGGWQVTLVEIESYILNRAFDPEFGETAETKLRERGVQVITSKGVKEIKGHNGKVQKVILTDNSVLETEAVVLSMGYSPNTALAKQCSIPLNELGFIKTCEYMRVPNLSSNDIFAVGDCA
jgi:NADPH-dependent 2,4-dienoyl-CoA reductase/sulfur reductase-like enzyme